MIMIALTEPTTTQGVQLSMNDDIRFPLTVSQCEPVIIYYDLSRGGRPVEFSEAGVPLLVLEIPNGTGYLEWICTIPAGYEFGIRVGTGFYLQYFIVQPGPSSSCLRNITTTYEYLSYGTTAFKSYTGHPPVTDSFGVREQDRPPTVPYTLDSFPTITINPELAISSTRSTALPWESTTAPAVPSRKSKTSAILGGGVVGGVIIIMMMLASALIFVLRRRRRNPQLQVADNPTATSDPLEATLGQTVLHIPNVFVRNASSANHDPSSLPSNAGNHQPRTPRIQSNLDTVSRNDSRSNADINQPAQIQPVSPVAMLQNDFVATLESFTQLNAEERRTFVSALRMLIAPENSAGGRRGDSFLGPPEAP